MDNRFLKNDPTIIRLGTVTCAALKNRIIAAAGCAAFLLVVLNLPGPSAFLDRFIDPATGHLHLFFDEHWDLKSDTISFGHDIEGSWLLLEAADRIDDPALLQRVRQESLRMAEAVLTAGVDTDWWPV